MPDVGEVLAERYELTGVLGKGGFGTVFAGFDRSLGREVAVKVLTAPSTEDVDRFVREARIVASLESEYIVRLFETGVDAAGSPFIVMERLRGVALNEYVRSRGGSLPVEEAVDFVVEACLALTEAHGQGIVHRDLKPQNLFVTERRDGTRILKLLDFGIAKWTTSSTLTQGQVTMGTLRYMAPEQIRDARSADTRADIWALGVVLYELLSGRPIFDADSDAAFGALVLTAEAEPLVTRGSHISEELAHLVHRCITRDRALRFESVGTLMHALSPFASEAGRRMALSSRRTGAAAAIASPGGTDPSAPGWATTQLESAPTVVAEPPTRTDTPAGKGGPEAATPTPPRTRGVSILGVAGVAVAGAAALLWYRGLGAPQTSPLANAVREAQSATAAPEPPIGTSMQSATTVAPPRAETSIPPTLPAASTVRAAIRTSAAVTSGTAAPNGPIPDADLRMSRKFVDTCVGAGPSVVPIGMLKATSLQSACNQFAFLGCARTTAMCESPGMAPDQQRQCKTFLAVLRAEGACGVTPSPH